MSHWIILRPEFSIDYQARTKPINQINFGQTTSDEMLEDIGAIAELKHDGITST